MINDLENDHSAEGLDVAVIGMSGRFPGAENIAQYWGNLRDGVESIRQFSDEELKSYGVSPTKLSDPGFVKAGAILENIGMFDAEFFGYSPREAAILDPQHRIFLECAWQALDDAGYNSDSQQNLIGVFAGTSLSTYLLYHLLADRDASQDAFQTMIGNDKDFLSTRISYELNLKGPSLDIQTACSTSLVAVHLACQNLHSYQCDLALAGGVSIQVPQCTGYYYLPGGISSPDGHCRVFDAQAQGTVFGSGVGVVVLKRLADALSDRDTIHAVIKGSAINNDGSAKIGYTAPSVDGQAQAISMAQIVAGVDPDTISYVEAHGTGTALGDPVEFAALVKAFRRGSEQNNYCALGSVKSNIGHLDAAAGVAGLIKTILALKHKQLPPSLHFENPNPQIELAESPFYISDRLREWSSNGSKRRAGVSSFGVGGTNAHVILEEAPEIEAGAGSREFQLILFSAKSQEGLECMSRDLVQHLKGSEDQNPADLSYTLQQGRKRMNYRRMAVGREAAELAQYLEREEPPHVLTAYQENECGAPVFMFPGGGAQYVNMGLDLYKSEKVFRDEIDRCCEILKANFRFDLRAHLYPDALPLEQAKLQIRRASVGLPALFSVEYAMAMQLANWGIEAGAMIGHSLGEYAAACLAGVFSLEDALTIVRLRGELFEESPKGGMVSVGAEENVVREMIGDELSIAAINGPQQVVVSGEDASIDAFCDRLTIAGIEHQRIHIEVAAHSHLLDGVLPRFEKYVHAIRKEKPIRRYISNVSGDWIKAEEAIDATYWRRQLRDCVRFSDGVSALIAAGSSVLIEVGPGQTLGSLARLHPHGNQLKWVIGTMRRSQEEQDDREFLTAALGKLWMAGVDVSWDRYYEGEIRRRVGAPSYPFQRRRYWVDPGAEPRRSPQSKIAGKKENVRDWLYRPGWRRKDLPWKQAVAESEKQEKRTWLVMEGDRDISRLFIERLESKGEKVIRVKMGASSAKIGDRQYQIRASERTDYDDLLDELAGAGVEIGRVAHLWSLDSDEMSPKDSPAMAQFGRKQQKGLFSLIFLAQSIESSRLNGTAQVHYVSRGLQNVESPDIPTAEGVTALGACKVITQECERVKCRSIDFGPKSEYLSRRSVNSEVDRLIREMEHGDEEQEVAYRGEWRYVKRFDPVSVAEPNEELWLKNGGVYIITGGTGNIGVELAEYLCRNRNAKAALISRNGVEGKGEECARRIERLGDHAMVERADVGNEKELREAVARIEKRFGVVNGLFHAAGLAGDDVVKLIPDVTADEFDAQFRAKVFGAYALAEILRDRSLDFCLLFSSNVSVLGGVGMVCYTAANSFLDAFAATHSKMSDARWISVNWDGWSLNDNGRISRRYQTSLDRYAMSSEQAFEALTLILSPGLTGQIVVSTGDLDSRLETWTGRGNDASSIDAVESELSAKLNPRPALRTKHVAAKTEIEKIIVNVWQNMLGISQLGVHDNFFDLGGNSLIGLKIISRLKKELNQDIPVTALFEGPTVSALAQVISSGTPGDATAEQSRSRGQRRRESVQNRRRKDDQVKAGQAN
jgi:phthiocerol/phenolphthiocerol synthesis type-I polyketide synthase E